MGVRMIARNNVQSKLEALMALIVIKERSTRGLVGTVTTLEENSQPAIVENTDGIGATKDDGSGAPDQREKDESR